MKFFKRDRDDSRRMAHIRKTKLKLRLQKKLTLRNRRRVDERELNLVQANLESYNQMSSDEKFDFALGGYRFANNPNVPAIKLFRTVLNAPEDKKRGLKVGHALPYLPEGFVILYSKSSVSTTRADGIKRFYQIGIVGKRFMQIHTTAKTRYGLANFVNAAIGCDVDLSTALTEETTQNMKRAQCLLQWSVSAYICLAYHIYESIVKPIPVKVVDDLWF